MRDRTDWDSYYEKPYKTSSITRKVTLKKLTSYFLDHCASSCASNPKIVEFGGANSCFAKQIIGSLNPKSYTVIDNNHLGLEKLQQRLGSIKQLKSIEADLLKPLPACLPTSTADIAYSVGLIEHFSPCDTKSIIESHFNVLKKGGLCLITFPTPTLLYNITRYLAEKLSLWIFWDERPLEFQEVVETVEEYGAIISKEINWATILTQGIVVARKL